MLLTSNQLVNKLDVNLGSKITSSSNWVRYIVGVISNVYNSKQNSTNRKVEEVLVLTVLDHKL